MKRKINISVVCATHKGSKKIKNLINSIYQNNIWPKEIVICGTSKSDLKFIPEKLVKLLDIKFIFSNIKSQVYQRKLAIQSSSSDYILQIDDDIIIKRNFFLKISKYTLSKYQIKKKIVSALILQKNGNLQAGSWNTIYNKYFIFRIILKILNLGKYVEEYSVLESGRCVPYIENFKGFLEKNVVNAQWLCSTVLYHRLSRKNIKYIKEFSKKAYYEDVLFSYQLYKKKYQLIIDKDVVGTHDNQPYTKLSTYFETLKTQYELVKFFKKNKILFFLDVIIFSIIHLLRDIYVILFVKGRL